MKFANPLRHLRHLRDRLLLQEDLNFLLTNRLPRAALTRFMGWFSQRRNPLVRELSIAGWKLFADLDLSDAKKQRFDSLHDCFIRELKPGTRPIDTDPAVLASPCDAIVGACGVVDGGQVFQAKGFPYTLVDLFGARAAPAEVFHDGCFVTLRLTSSMYHRFHAPHGLTVQPVAHHSGDTWHVTPAALVPVAAILVAASGCTGSTPCCINAAAARTSCRGPRTLPSARRWAGFSTDRPSWCLRRAGLRWPTASHRASRSARATP